MAVSRINEAGLNVNQYGNRNLIINGAMQVAQRGTSGTSGPDGTGESYLTVDRWKNPLRTSAVATQSQSTDTPAGQGFIHSFKLDCTTADTSVASDDFWIFQQRMEKQNVLQLEYGTSSAKSVTVSFWVRSTKTGTYICELQDAVNDRYNRGAYTIDAADTWEKKTITFVGDTGGGLGTSSLNGVSLDLNFWLMAGSDFSGGSAVSGWTATGGGRANGQVNFFDSTSNNWYITGVQFEVGDTATDFEHRTYGDEFNKCCRYYQKLNGGTGAQYQRFGSGLCNSTTNCFAEVTLITPMRTVPTVDTTGTASNYAINHSSGTVSALSSVPSIEATADNPLHTVILNSVTTSLTGGNYGVLIANNSTSAYLGFDAEL